MKCPYCNSDIDDNVMVCPSCNASITKKEKIIVSRKNDKTLLALIILTILIFISSTIFCVIYFMNSKKENIDETIYETTIFLGEKLIIPKGYNYTEMDKNEYIFNDKCSIKLSKSTLSYEYILKNTETYKKGLENRGFIIESTTNEQLYGNDYIIITGLNNNISTGYMIGKFHNNNILITIKSINSNGIDVSCFNDSAYYLFSSSFVD